MYIMCSTTWLYFICTSSLIVHAKQVANLLLIHFSFFLQGCYFSTRRRGARDLKFCMVAKGAVQV